MMLFSAKLNTPIELKTMRVGENLVDIHGSSHFEMKSVRIDEKLVDMRGSPHCVLTRRRELYHSALTSHRIENSRGIQFG
jgi:hypothetical protein